MEKILVRGKEKYNLAGKKKEYDKEVKALQGKTHYDYKRSKQVPIKPKQGFLARAVREFYSDLADVKRYDNNVSKVLKFAKRCHEKYLNYKLVDEEPSKKRFCESRGGRKCKAPEIREEIFEWFINVQGVLKEPLPMKMFRSRCQHV